MKISGNTIFIPGATSGIGLGLAKKLNAAGNTVIIGGRRKALIDQIVEENPGIAGLAIDTSDPDSITTAVDQITSRFPETNVLITMAGIMAPEDFRTGEFLSMSESIVTTNLLGPIRLIAAFVEHLAEREDAVIMNVSSGLASVPLAITPTYNATKAAIHMLSDGIRLQLADAGIQVMELVPPKVQTSLMGSPDAADAMPLEDYLAETMALIESQPDATEILVERVKFLRYAETRGDYDHVVEMLNSAH